MIINRIYETQNLLSLQLVYFLIGIRTYQHPCEHTRTVSHNNKNVYFTNEYRVSVKYASRLNLVYKFHYGISSTYQQNASNVYFTNEYRWSVKYASRLNLVYKFHYGISSTYQQNASSIEDQDTKNRPRYHFLLPLCEILFKQNMKNIRQGMDLYSFKTRTDL